jgi:Domain of unknown function (DUF4112)
MIEKRSKLPEVEIIPPEKSRTGAHAPADPLAKDPTLTWLAALMDSAFVIPGTTVRIGLDPIIGFIPVLGDVVGTFVSTFIVVRCGALGLPRIVIARMTINVLLNSLIGVIPIAGDIFSVWFRSNERNLELARVWLANPKRATTQDWAVVLGILAALCTAAFGIVLIIAVVLRGIWELASSAF